MYDLCRWTPLSFALSSQTYMMRGIERKPSTPILSWVVIWRYSVFSFYMTVSLDFPVNAYWSIVCYTTFLSTCKGKTKGGKCHIFFHSISYRQFTLYHMTVKLTHHHLYVKFYLIVLLLVNLVMWVCKWLLLSQNFLVIHHTLPTYQCLYIFYSLFAVESLLNLLENYHIHSPIPV